MKKHSCIFLLLLLPFISFSQEDNDLLDLLGPGEETTNYVTNAFKSPRVINSHSMEMLREGVLDFRILHRFGDISNGAYELFGLDNASMRIGFDYGVTDNLSVGIGRSTYFKELDGFVKYRFLQQSTGKRTTPLSLVWVSGITYNGLRDPYPGELGVIKEGALADLILVDGNPLEDLDLVADADANFLIIMKDGVIYKNTLEQ